MKSKRMMKLMLNKQVICTLDMRRISGGAPDTLTWGCSENGYTCDTCDYECQSREMLPNDTIR